MCTNVPRQVVRILGPSKAVVLIEDPSGGNYEEEVDTSLIAGEITVGQYLGIQSRYARLAYSDEEAKEVLSLLAEFEGPEAPLPLGSGPPPNDRSAHHARHFL